MLSEGAIFHQTLMAEVELVQPLSEKVAKHEEIKTFKRFNFLFKKTLLSTVVDS